MVEERWEELRERLLARGVAPKYVARVLQEMQTHRDAMADEMIAQGWLADAAAEEADRRLGLDTVLVEQFDRHVELKSWAHRHPWTTFVVFPACTLIFLFACLVLASGLLSLGMRSDPDLALLRFIRECADALVIAATWGLPVAVAVGWCGYAAKRRVTAGWSFVGALAAALPGALLQLSIDLPEREVSGLVLVGLGADPAFASELLLRALIPLVVTLPYAGWRKVCSKSWRINLR